MILDTKPVKLHIYIIIGNYRYDPGNYTKDTVH